LFHIFAAWTLQLNFSQQMTLTWMRLDAILAGVVVAGAEPLCKGVVGRILCIAGWGGIAAISLIFLLTDPLPDYNPRLLMVAPRTMGDLAHATEVSLVPLLFAITLPAMAAWRPARPTGPGWRLIQITALLSYALYLVHWDVFRFTAGSPAGHLHPVAGYCVALSLSLLLAALLHVAVERPWMTIRDRIAPERLPYREPSQWRDERLTGV
jgi:peptidoglycan/LPS O-acetylase OafA/YrhL